MQPLSALGAVQTGSTPATSEERFWGGDIPFVTPAELDQNQAITNTPRTLSPQGGAQSRLLNEGAILICCIGSLGKIGIAGRALVTNQQINSVEFNSQKVFPRYGFYACQRLKQKLQTMAPATTVPIVSKSKFEQLEIPVPPLLEQRRIAAILDQADSLRAKRRETLVQLESLTQAIFIEMFGNPAKNEKRWKAKHLVSLGKVSTGATPPGSKDGMFGGAIPFITPGDLESDQPVKRSLTEAGAAEVSKVRPGSTLVCCIGTIGKIGIASTTSTFNQQINAVEWGDEIDDYYGFSVMRFFKPTIIAWGTSTTLPILKKSKFEKIEIPVPPIGLQQEFSSRLSKTELMRHFYKSSLNHLDELFNSLQSRAFKGEL